MDIEIWIVEDRAGTVGIYLSLGNVVYVGSIETAERLVGTLTDAIREARRRERGAWTTYRC